MRKCIVSSILLMSLFTEGAFANGVRTALSFSCDHDSKIELKISNFSHLFDEVSGGSFGYGIFFQRRGESKVCLYNDAFSPSDLGDHRYPDWYAVLASYGNTLVGPMTTDQFAPLPSRANTSTVRVFEVPQRTYDRRTWTWGRPKDNPPFLNIFLDPRVISKSDFVRIADCLESHRSAFNQALSALRFSNYFKTWYHPLRLGGVVLGGAPYDDSNYIETVKSVWGEGNAQNDVLPLPTKDYEFTLYPGETAQGRFGGYDLTLFIDASGVSRVNVHGKTLTFPPNGGYSNEESAIAGSKKEGWYFWRRSECVGEIKAISHNLDHSITFYAYAGHCGG